MYEASSVNADPRKLGFEGTIIAGSYDPVNSTVDVSIGMFLADFDDTGDGDAAQPITVALETSQIGDQAAPQGGERVVIFPSYGGWRAFLHHGPDDSPQVPMGERHILHAKVGTLGAGNTPAWDAGVKLTNDGPTEDDALGGTYVGNDGALTQSQTKSGARHTIDDTAQTVSTVTAGKMTGVYDDTAQTITHSPTEDLSIQTRLDAVEQTIRHLAGSGIFTLLDAIAQKITHQASPQTFSLIDAAGNVITHQSSPATFAIIDGVAQKITHQGSGTAYTIVDGLGNEISHIVPAGTGKIGLGALFADLPGASGAVNNDILNTFGGNINSAILQTLINHAGAMVTAGIPNASSLIPLIVASLIQNVTVPPGSGIVRIAS